MKKWVQVLWWGYSDKGEKFKGFYYKIHDNGVDMNKYGGGSVYWEKQGDDVTALFPPFVLTSQKGVVKK